MSGMQPRLKYLRKNFDEIAILAALGKVAIGDTDNLSIEEKAVLTAFRRSSPKLEDASVEDIGEYLNSYDAEQIPGLVNNVKGILHEIEFVEIENSDGDAISAAIFADTNHPETDILMHDNSSGASWEVQLKATDDGSYVADWIESHPDGDIFVTEELANKLDLDSSGISNEELTYRVEDVVDKLIRLDEDDGIWDYVPGIGLASVSILVFALWRRYKSGEISYAEFKSIAAKTTGLKLTKIGFLAGALAIPGLNVAAGSYLVARLILTADTLTDKFPSGFATIYKFILIQRQKYKATV